MSRIFFASVLVFLTILLGGTPPAGAAVLYVAPSGDDGNACLTFGEPCATIQAAVDKATAGDTVQVAVGVYSAGGITSLVTLTKDLTLVGGWDSSFATAVGLSTIDGLGQRRGIEVTTGVTASIRRFSIRNGSTGEFGGAIRNQGVLTVNRSRFADSFAYGIGGAIYSSGTLTLRNSAVIRNVSRQSAGGVYNSGTMSISNTTITLNRATTGGGLVMENNGSLSLHNVTITGNKGFVGGGIFAFGDITITIRNSIVAHNQSARSGTDCYGTVTALDYSLIGATDGCTLPAGLGNLTGSPAGLGGPIGEPEYVPLAFGSAAVDAGDPTGCADASGPLLSDERGASRIGRCDMGAYEYRLAGAVDRITAVSGSGQRTAPRSRFQGLLQAAVLDAIGSPIASVSVTLTAPATGASGVFPGGGTGTSLTTDSFGIASTSFTANATAGSYAVLATAAGAAGSASFDLSNAGWFIAPTGNDAHGCDSPGAPCATVSAVLQKSSFHSGDTLLLADGRYRAIPNPFGPPPSAAVVVAKNARLSGGWDESFLAQTGFSTLDGEGARPGLIVSAIVLAERLLVTGGNTNFRGGGVAVSGDLTLEDSTITGNTGRSGAGLYNGGFLTLVHSRVEENVATQDGGGIQNEGLLVVRESAFLRNAASNGGAVDNRPDFRLFLENSTISGNSAIGAGGALQNLGIALLSNDTLVQNSAAVAAGGVVQATGSLGLADTIVASNTAPSSPDCQGSLDSLGYNLVGDPSGCALGSASGDLTGIDPAVGPLVGAPSYHPLLAGSPAIDAGDPNGCRGAEGLLLVDQRRLARQGRCDIGAYEYADPGVPAVVYAWAGTPQQTPVSQAFPDVFQAAVLDAVGTPVGSVEVTFQAPASGPGGTFTGTGDSSTTVLTAPSGIATAPLFKADGTGGRYVVTGTVDGVADPALFSLLNVGYWYVSATGSDAYDCLSPSAACATIDAAIAQAIVGATIRVSSGIYTGTGSEVALVTKSIVLSGGWDATFGNQDGASVIDGQHARAGVSVSPGVTATIERFIIENGITMSPGVVAGGVTNNGTLVLNQCTVRNNVNAGILNMGDLTLNGSTVSGNTNNSGGGGIDNLYAVSLTLNNSTLSGNSASSTGGAIRNFNSSPGGGPVAINYSTITSNTAGFRGGGIDPGIRATVTMRGTILAGNTGPFGRDCGNGFESPIHSEGDNLVGDSVTCDYVPATGDVLNVPPGLGPLADNGGPTFTHALTSASPAIGAAGSGCPQSQADQRGIPRPQGHSCDIGAYEFTDFDNGFESGDLSRWSFSATDAGDLSVSGAAALHGTTFGLAAVVNDTNSLYVEDDSPRDENRYRARFYFDPNGFDPGESQSHFRTRIFLVFTDNPRRRLAAIVLKRQGGAYSVKGRCRLDDGTQADTGFIPISDGPHVIELDWKRSTGSDANDGTFQLWIDGSSVATLTGLDSSLGAVDFVRMGALSVKTGAWGTMYWDEFASRRENDLAFSDAPRR